MSYRRLGLVTAVLIILAAACTINRPPTPSATPLPRPTDTATPMPTSTPVPTPTPEIGEINLAVPVEATHWDPHMTASPALAAWGPGLVYSRLLRFRAGPDVAIPTMATECDLCVSWQQLSPTTYRFKLRQDVFWQDLPPVSGRPLVAQDLVYSFRRQGNPIYPNASLLQSVKTLEAEDDHTLKIVLERPDPEFPSSLASGFSKIVAPEAVAVNGDLKEGPVVGSGPWLLDGTRGGVGYFFTANPDYYEDDLPGAQRLNIHIIGDEQTRTVAFRLQKLDLIEAPGSELESLKREYPAVESLLFREAGSGLELALNTTTSPLNNLQVRKAIFHALDPWASIENVWSGLGFVSLGMPVADADWLLPEEEMRSYLADPAAAMDLFSAAPDGLSPSFTLAVADYGDAYLEYGQRVVQQLEAVGFQVNVEIVNRQEYPQRVWYGGQYSAFIGPIAPMTTPNMYLLSVLHSRGAWNTHGYRDSALDSLIEEQATSLDPLRRREVVLEIQRHMMDKAVRFMPVTRVSAWVWWPKVQGFYPNFISSEYFHLARLTVEP